MTAAGAARRLGRALSGAGGVFAVAFVLTAWMAAPVLVDPSTRLFGREIAGRHHDPFTVIGQFENPAPIGLYTQPATDYAGALAARVLGNGVSAYNLMVLATFPLAALFTFLLARRLTGSPQAAWPAALLYAFLPYHWAHAAYHPQGAQTQWLPLYLLALWMCAERFSPWRALLLGLAAALVSLSNFYYGLIAAVLTPVMLLGQWGLAVSEKRERPHHAPAATAGVLLGLAAAGLTYVARWAPTVLSNPAPFAFPRADVARYTARWWCYLVPPVDHPLGGERLASFWGRQDTGGLVEHQLTLGLGVLALAALAVFVRLRGERSPLLRPVPLLALLAAAAFVTSMPPVWRLGPVSISAPSGLLHELAPMFRAHARFGLAMGLASVILAGIGLRLLWLKPPSGRAAACVLTALVAVELAPFPPWRWRDVLPTSAHRWLAEQNQPLRILDCVAAADLAEASTDRFIGQTLKRLPPHTDCGDPQIPARFTGEGFSHLLVRRNSDFGRWLDDGPAPSGLEPIGHFDDALLFRLDQPSPFLLAAFGGGFHRREYKDGESYRWMAQRGRLDLLAAAARSRPAALDLVLHAFPERREVEALLDGRSIATFPVTTDSSTVRLDLGELGPGRYQLELVALAPATMPDSVLGNGDRRPLSIALWDWTWTTGESGEPAGLDPAGAVTPPPPKPRRSGS